VRLSRKALLALSAIFVASLVGATVLPVADILRAVAVVPGVAALIGAVFVIVRDHAAHERALALHRDDQQFQVGAMSHMSAVVFDKHVTFCEEYMAEVNKTIETLVREHANVDAVGHANTLYTLRMRHATWVTASMSARLSGFEDAVRKMGAQAHFINTTTGDPRYAEQRAAAIEFVFAEFERIMPHLFSKTGEEGVSVESIQQRVRTMLGIEELVALRTKLVARAHKALTD
jgi:hypothetical protein